MSSPKPGVSGLQNYSDNEECISVKNRKRQRLFFDESDKSSNSGQNYNADDTLSSSDSCNDENDYFYYLKTTEESDYSDDDEDEDDEDEDDEVDETSEDSGEWTINGDFKDIEFTGNPGLKILPKDASPYSYFELLFDESFFDLIVKETNDYAENFSEDWKKITVPEFKTFLGLTFLMGIIKLPHIQDYWSTDPLLHFKCFSNHMSRNRFQNILKYLHFSSNDGNENRLNKIQPIIDFFNNKMKELYSPHKELSIDESMVPWKGRLIFRQYLSGKKHKYGIKVYIITEASGIVLRLKIYKGKDDETGGKGHATKVVQHLLNDFLNKGHAVYMDNFYMAFSLAESLLSNKTYCTGTVRKSRKDSSKVVVSTKLKRGDIISRFKNNIMMGKYYDKREVLFASSEFKGDIVEITNKRNKVLKKPLALVKYNDHMNGIDRKDQMLSYYANYRKSLKWYRKIWANVTETLLLNSFYLYKKYTPLASNKRFYDFRMNIIQNLLSQTSSKNIVMPPSITEHALQKLQTARKGNKNITKRKRCKQCYSKGKRKDTNYYCQACEGAPGLCLGTCFTEFHRNLS